MVELTIATDQIDQQEKAKDKRVKGKCHWLLFDGFGHFGFQRSKILLGLG